MTRSEALKHIKFYSVPVRPLKLTKQSTFTLRRKNGVHFVLAEYQTPEGKDGGFEIFLPAGDGIDETISKFEDL